MDLRESAETVLYNPAEQVSSSHGTPERVCPSGEGVPAGNLAGGRVCAFGFLGYTLIAQEKVDVLSDKFA